MPDIHKELKATLIKLEQARKVDRHLADLNQQLQQAYDEQDRLERKLAKEFKDIEKLEKLSVKGLFHTVLGSKEEQIEKERQEYLQVSLKFDEAKKSTELLEYERDLLQKKVSDLANLERKLEGLLKMREKTLIAENTTVGKQILDIVLLIDTHQEFIRGIIDVKDTGQKALLILEKMEGHLKKARNWGQWDMTGRQRGASYMKHSAIDRARDLSVHVKHLLVRFQKDVRHIYGPEQFNLHIQIDNFSRFTDIFFDNLISDWIIQQKIQNALSSVVTVHDRVARILQSLDGEISKTQDKMAQLEDKRKKLIITS